VLLALAGFVSVWALMRSAERLPASLRGSSDPRAVWLVALPVWMAMAVAIQAAAPGAAYLWSLPLLTAGLSLAALPLRWPFLLRLVSAGILIVAALFWVRDAWVLHHFLVEQMARLPIRPPASIYVVVPMGAGLMLAPPLIAACGGAWFAGARRRGMQVIIFALAAAAIGVALAPSYTFDRPQRRSVRYLSDELSGTAAWEVGGLEAALDLDESVADVPGGWARADAPLGSSLPLAAMRRPFVYRAPGLRLPFPGDVHVRAAPIGEAVAVELTVVAPEDSEVTFAIPSAVAVGQPTLSGVVRRGYWVASYVGPPVGGVTIGFRLALGDLDRLGASAVVLSRPRVGGGLRPGQLPRWLPQDRAVWTASEVFVRPVADAIRAAAGAAAVARASLR
jgi:hypothetical protein